MTASRPPDSISEPRPAPAATRARPRARNRLTRLERALGVLRREYEKRGNDGWMQPYQIATKLGLRRGAIRYLLPELAARKLAWRRPSGRSWYGNAGTEYRYRLPED